MTRIIFDTSSDVGAYSDSKIDISIPDHTVGEAYVSEDGTTVSYDLVFAKRA